MLITELKPKDEIMAAVKGKTVVLSCEGCKEVYFPESEAAQLQKELLVSGTALAVITTDYVCNCENLELQVQKHLHKIDASDMILVFSCGVGVQTIAEHFAGKQVYAACDTLALPGHQGVTPLEYECEQCGQCFLNSTGGICPITACSKSLVNGQCGGSKDGKCEVDTDMECGWERIYRRLEKYDMTDTLRYPVKIRNYSITDEA